MNITVVGGGLIGSSWCALFLAHGHQVTVYDVAPDVAPRVRAELHRIAPVLDAMGLPLDPVNTALRFVRDLAEAVAEADVVQECGPERVAFKQQLWADVEQHAPPGAMLLSSSSGIPASVQSRRLRNPGRLLVAHPFNPPHLMPLVELAPYGKTDRRLVAHARALFESMGKRVVVLNKEIPGFVANRIQAAVIRESVALVRQGVVSAADLDTAVTQSLGLRWATGGPFLSAHLGGGAGGIRAFFHQFATGLQLLWLHMRMRPVWLNRAAQCALTEEVTRAYGDDTLGALASQRDLQQVALLRALRASALHQDKT